MPLVCSTFNWYKSRFPSVLDIVTLENAFTGDAGMQFQQDVTQPNSLCSVTPN